MNPNIKDTECLNKPSDNRRSAIEVGSCGMRESLPVVGPDQEVWVKDRIAAAIRMGIAIHKAQNVGADALLVEHGVEGVINGAAIEIIHTLGLQPGYVNLKLR